METETVYSVEVQIDSLLGNPPSGVTDEKVKKSTFHNRVCVTSQETKLPGLKEIQPVITIKKNSTAQGPFNCFIRSYSYSALRYISCFFISSCLPGACQVVHLMG